MTTIKTEYKCPKCGSVNKISYNETIVCDNSNIREKITNLQYFKRKCCDCNEEIKSIYPFILIDNQLKLVVSLNKDIDGVKRDEQIGKYILRKCNILEEVAEKILIFSDKLCDKTIELLKITLFAVIHMKDESITNICYYKRDQYDNLHFSVFYGEEIEGISVNMQKYMEIKEMIDDLDCDKEIVIDREWAGRQITKVFK